jgi:hypothetical protein
VAAGSIVLSIRWWRSKGGIETTYALILFTYALILFKYALILFTYALILLTPGLEAQNRDIHSPIVAIKGHAFHRRQRDDERSSQFTFTDLLREQWYKSICATAI